MKGMLYFTMWAFIAGFMLMCVSVSDSHMHKKGESYFKGQ